MEANHDKNKMKDLQIREVQEFNTHQVPDSSQENCAAITIKNEPLDDSSQDTQHASCEMDSAPTNNPQPNFTDFDRNSSDTLENPSDNDNSSRKRHQDGCSGGIAAKRGTALEVESNDSVLPLTCVVAEYGNVTNFPNPFEAKRQETVRCWVGSTSSGKAQGEHSLPKTKLLNSVSDYLNETAAGVLLIKQLSSNQCDDAVRNELADYVIKREFGSITEKVITPLRFEQLAAEIVSLFPLEEIETYYIPRRRKSAVSDAVNPRGKLYNKYTKFVSQLRKVNLRSKAKASDDSDDMVVLQHSLSDSDVSSDLQWIRNCMDPQLEAVCRWTRTSAVRIQDLIFDEKKSSRKKSTIVTVTAYLNTYRSLRQPWGHFLLDIDFKYIYPGKELNLVLNWESISGKLNALAKLRKVDIESIITPECDAAVKTLFIIPKLFKPRSVGKWKPNSLEVSQGFLLHVNTVEDLYNYVLNLKENLQKYGKTVQPFPVIVAKDLRNIEHSYVFLDNFYYSVESPLKAVDTCFKAFHALHTLYPFQSEAPWQFLQQAIYGIRSEWDSGIPAVSALVKDYQNLVLIS